MQNNQGLLVTDDGHAVGYLMDFTGHGIYSPDGQVQVTADEAKQHNALLDEGMLLGLAKCQVGQYGTFYLTRKYGTLCGQPTKQWDVTTFLGTVVASAVRVRGDVVTFRYKLADGTWGTFRGRRQKDADCFNFRRIA